MVFIGRLFKEYLEEDDFAENSSRAWNINHSSCLDLSFRTGEVPVPAEIWFAVLLEISPKHLAP